MRYYGSPCTLYPTCNSRRRDANEALNIRFASRPSFRPFHAFLCWPSCIEWRTRVTLWILNDRKSILDFRPNMTVTLLWSQSVVLCCLPLSNEQPTLRLSLFENWSILIVAALLYELRIPLCPMSECALWITLCTSSMLQRYFPYLILLIFLMHPRMASQYLKVVHYIGIWIMQCFLLRKNRQNWKLTFQKYGCVSSPSLSSLCIAPTRLWWPNIYKFSSTLGKPCALWTTNALDIIFKVKKRMSSNLCHVLSL